MPLAKSHRYPKTGNGREALFFFLLVRYSLGVVGGVDANDFFDYLKLQWK